jgi:hypothetical protein
VETHALPHTKAATKPLARSGVHVPKDEAPFYGNGPLCRLDLDQVLDPGKVRDVSGVQAS